MQPKTYVSYSDEAPPSVTALFYLDAARDLYGWYLAGRERQVSAAYFMIEHFYADRLPILYRSIADDVYEPWTTDYPPKRNLIRCPLPDAVAHELEHLQSLFIQEWLFFDSDPAIEAELAAYRARGLCVQAANIRSRKLNRLGREHGHWIHTTPGADFNVVYFLEKHWRFDLRLPQSRAARYSRLSSR
ncbi:MAG TPA: hypothetical protein VEC06_06680 [Paucimonas sp.]|nr:hypothetical protein [Paucimonas sp.]